VLSACSTGRQEASWKHPLQDIVETMSSLGVPNVVATRWQIDSKATVPFMDAFYSSLAKGGSPAMALAYARKLQSGQVLYNNPYYWGAYYVTTTESLNRRRTVHVSRYN
jgi:CHAT domain-containing protein